MGIQHSHWLAKRWDGTEDGWWHFPLLLRDAVLQAITKWPAMTFSMASNVVEMVWEWSSLWPFPHTDTHTHTFRSTSGSRSTSQPPSPSLTSPRGQLWHVRWTAGTRDLENYWHQVQVGSCILHVRILWLAFEGHVTCVWQTFDLVCKDHMTCVEGHVTGMWGPCTGHVTYRVACMWPTCEYGYVNVLICAGTTRWVPGTTWYVNVLIPTRTSYIDQMSASYDKRMSQEVVNLRLWEHLQVRCHSLLQLGCSSATHSPSFPPFSPSISFSPSPSLSLFLPQIKHLICMYTYTYMRGPL